MIIFLNGQFVPEEQALVSIFDRSFLYGDGLFETVRVFDGQPFRWEQHLERFERGAQFLRIGLPLPPAALRGFAGELIARNGLTDALLRLTLSRGVGRRGYSPRGAEQPSLNMSLHPAPLLDLENPPRWRLVTSTLRLPAGDPLAQFKTCNKLPQILARAEADRAGADEALLLNTDGHVIESSSANLFWLADGAVCMAPLTSGALPGVTRAVVLELCPALGLKVRQTSITPEGLLRAEGVFLSLSSVGIVEAVSLDGQPLRISNEVGRIRRAYAELCARETGSGR
jgi:branched-chain amino acid aminotransferase